MVTFIIRYSFLLGSLSCYFTGFLTLIYNRKNPLYRSWFYLSLLAGTWSLAHFLMAIIKVKSTAFTLAYVLYYCAILVLPAYQYFVYLLVNIYEKEYKDLYLTFFISLLFLLLLPSNSFIRDVIPRSGFNFYDSLGNIGGAFLLFYILGFSFVFYKLFKCLTKATGRKREQLRYVALASIFGFLGGGSSFTLALGELLPYATPLFLAYPLLIAYAIFRYQLLDIRIVVTRFTIFALVYSLVLGLPFIVAFGLQDQLKSYLGDIWWLSPLILLTVLATAGPFIYLYIQRRAEEKLFYDQRRYQATLRQAATGMGRIKDMEKLIGLIEHVIKESVGVEHCRVLNKTLLARGCNISHDLSAMSFAEGRNHEQSAMSYEPNEVLIYSELKQRALDNPGGEIDGVKLAEIVAQMEKFNAELIVPVILDGKIIARIVIGRKISGELFSNDDISVFEILASQAALGIENAQYYDDIKSANERLFQAEKLAYVGTLASSVVHEIRNPLTAIKTYLSFLPAKYHEPEFQEKFNRLVPSEIERIERIVSQLLDLGKKRDVVFQKINIVEILDSTLEMLENSFQLKNIEIVRDYQNRPVVEGEGEQLKQVFINLFLNAVQAMEDGGRLTVRVKNADSAIDSVEICVEDTGIGIKPDMMAKLFKPFQTTKKNGIGLGLSILKEIIEKHKGNVLYQSEDLKGTKVYVTLPTC